MGDSLASFRDSLQVSTAGADAGTDTLRRVGSIAGRIELQPGDERRAVLILVLGTNSISVPQDTSGIFVLSGLAEGEYRVRFLSTLPDYAPQDTILRVQSGIADTLSSSIRLPYLGIPAVGGLQAVWDPVIQTVNLQWLAGDTSNIAGYNIYRAPGGAALGSTPLNTRLVEATTYRDTAIDLGTEYVYAVKAVDRNGNVGGKFPDPVSVSTSPDYVLSKTIKPEGPNRGTSPLAIRDGEIYSLLPNRVDVYDSTGTLHRSFGSIGVGALRFGIAIRVIGDTVYVLDNEDSRAGTAENRACIRMFSKQGDYLDSLSVEGMFGEKGIQGISAGFNLTAEGVLFASTGSMLYSYSPDGRRDSSESPLAPELRHSFSTKLEAVGEKLLIMGSIRNFSTKIGKTQLAFLNQDLSLERLETASYFLNAFASDSRGNIWIITDEGQLQVMTESLEVIRRINLPKSLYRDIQVEGGVVYIYDYTSESIHIYRK